MLFNMVGHPIDTVTDLAIVSSSIPYYMWNDNEHYELLPATARQIDDFYNAIPAGFMTNPTGGLNTQFLAVSGI